VKISLFAFLLAASCAAFAEDIILAPDAFLADTFAGQPPPPRTLWLTGELGDAVRDVLGHPPPNLRVRFWRQAQRSAWILEEIGKESPITAGFVVENGQLINTALLIYRESRGGEIRFASFLEQFPGSRLRGKGLDRKIDNISSATLSVKAMKRMAVLALLLDQHSS
jgi:hypothetical protein